MITRTYCSEDLPLLRRFISQYRTAYPDAKVADAELYTYHPAVANGQHAFCVIDSDAVGGLVGFAPMFVPVTSEAVDYVGPQKIWTIVLAEQEHRAAQEIRAALYAAVLQRAREIKERIAPHPLQLAADMMISQRDDIDALIQRGFRPFAKVYVMQRSLDEVIPPSPLSASLMIQPSRLTGEEEQAEYLRACNVCFAQEPRSQADLRFLMDSPRWQRGCAIIARDRQLAIAGSVLVYIDDGEQSAGVGVMDDVFVMPNWRGQGLAKALIGRALTHLREQGLTLSRLEVDASNAPAIAAYRAMGYRVVNEEQLLGLIV